MAHVLGINCSGFHAAACLLGPEGVHTAICEERLSRVKRDRRFPLRAIAYCLEHAGLELADLEHAFIGWHPRFYLRQSDHTLRDAFRSRGKLAYLALNELATLTRAEITDITQRIFAGESRVEIHFVDHHRAHAANAFYQSGFADADFLVLDGFGEVSTGLAGKVSREVLEPFAAFRTPHSLGSFYSTVTDFLGFEANADEWKVMALAALGDPDRFYPAVRALVRVEGLRLELDLSYFEHFLFFTPRYFSDKFVAAFGAPLARGAAPPQTHADLAAAFQRVSEEVVFELLRSLAERTGSPRLVLGGGYFMNCVCNGKIAERTPYWEVYIGGSPDDSGVAVGSAFQGACRTLGWAPPTAGMNRSNYWGRAYPREEIEAELARRKIRYRAIERPEREAAERLAAGEILGWFQGRSEFGQRALGNRSILADPRDPEMKGKINASVKYREGFRPFAPSVLVEKQAEIFAAIEAPGALFMERVHRLRPQAAARLPAVTHLDGSGRLHSVDAAVNPLFHALIVEFERLTGCPVVLNTSFNTSGMPLVETPGDALDCFYASGLDTLILGSALVEK